MNQISALIMMRRKITAATTQMTIKVIFERRKALELGKMSAFRKRKNRSSDKTRKSKGVTSCVHGLIEAL